MVEEIKPVSAGARSAAALSCALFVIAHLIVLRAVASVYLPRKFVDILLDFAVNPLLWAYTLTDILYVVNFIAVTRGLGAKLPRGSFRPSLLAFIIIFCGAWAIKESSPQIDPLVSTPFWTWICSLVMILIAPMIPKGVGSDAETD